MMFCIVIVNLAPLKPPMALLSSNIVCHLPHQGYGEKIYVGLCLNVS